MREIIDVGWVQLLLALLMVGVIVWISVRQHLALQRDLIIATFRATLQLILVGYYLDFIFGLRRWQWVMLTLAIMLGIATWTAAGRLRRRLPALSMMAAGSLALGSAITLAFSTQVVLRVSPWYDPQYLIPMGGMILGNAMNGAALAGERLQGDLRARLDEVETRLTLGFSGPEALLPLTQSALRAAMIPTINSMMVVGVVQFPGMMTGQILAGTSPLIAVKYQLIILIMIAAAVAVSALCFLRLLLRRYLTPAHQLRRHLIG
ncbi:MAG: iron export ABC transporter permease subunit FetB [Candidatus Methylomirabilales bacterium]